MNISYLDNQLDKCKKKIQDRIKFNEPIPPILLQIYNNIANAHYTLLTGDNEKEKRIFDKKDDYTPFI